MSEPASGPTNHRIVVTDHGDPEVLQLIEEKLPQPSAGEVRVKVQAAGVSAFDLMFRKSGRLPGSPKPPFTPGEDVVGVVDALGEGATAFEIGQTVVGVTFSLGIGGGYTEHLCLAESELIAVPPGVDPAEAVCVAVNYITAHMMMHRVAHAKAGQRILVQGAAGGVGSALLDLGRAADLEMYGTASAHNHEVVQSLGATPIDYRTEDFVARIGQLTDDGVDIVFDPVGGGKQLRRSYRCLRKGGQLIWFGIAASKERGLRLIPGTLFWRLALSLWPDGKSAPLTPDLSKDHEWYERTQTELLGMLASGQLTPLIAEKIPLAEAWRAHDLLENGRYAGKVVLVT